LKFSAPKGTVNEVKREAAEWKKHLKWYTKLRD
jgi:hypothetical protein